MEPQQLFLLALLGAVLFLFVWGRWRFDIVAIGAMLLVAITGIIPPERVFLGFGHPATLTVAMVLVLSRGLWNSGVVDLLAEHVFRPLGSITGQIGLMSFVAASLSAVPSVIQRVAISVIRGGGIQAVDRTPDRILSTALSGAAMKPMRSPKVAHLVKLVTCSVRSGANEAIGGAVSGPRETWI